MLWLATALAAPADDFDAAIGRMLTEVAALRDATFDLHQQEYVNGQLDDPVVMRVKWRPRNEVSVVWPDGQTLLWVPGANGDKMRVNPAGLVPALWLSPESTLATRGQRHTVRRMGLAPVAELFAEDRARMSADPSLLPTVSDLGSSVIHGRTARCFDATMPKDREPRLYASRVEVCVDVETGLPARMRTYEHEDGALRLVEDYGYENVRVNVGLTDADFTP